MTADFKLTISKYLKELVSSPVRSLADIIAFNEKNPELEKLKEYGQDGLIEAENMSGNEEEIERIKESLDELCQQGFEKMMDENQLDAMVTPGTKAIPVMAIGGYPGITVPAGYDEEGKPFGMLFSGLRGSEVKLIETAFGFEQATLKRKPPVFDSPEWEILIYSSCAETYRLTESGELHVPPEDTDNFCEGPCQETSLVSDAKFPLLQQSNNSRYKANPFFWMQLYGATRGEFYQNIIVYF